VVCTQIIILLQGDGIAFAVGFCGKQAPELQEDRREKFVWTRRALRSCRGVGWN
jgi:hypothetical protein